MRSQLRKLWLEMRGVDVGFRLWLLFLVFLVGWVGAFLASADSHRIVSRLETNPQRYLDYVEQTIFFLIAPSIVEIAFIAITNVSSRKFWVDVLSWWPVLVTYGILFLLFSSFGLFLAVHDYNSAIRESAASLEHLRNPLFAIYASAAAGFSLWALAGFLFLITPLRKRRKRSVGAVR
jgi:glucan phosphoethanolaminetransferase (alkaline phosphatase superfamily)